MNINLIRIASRNISLINTIVYLIISITTLRVKKTKHDCLIYENLSPSPNGQSDSIKGKLFI